VPPLPPPLTPTIAIEVAPPAVAMLGYFAIHGDRVDGPAAGLGGYGLLMVLAQLRLLPAYRRLSFAPGFWAFTFSWAAVVTAALHWLVDLQPTGWRVYGYLLLAAISVLVGAIAARTLLAAVRGELLPRRAAIRGTA
jgi:tellurite resistance protein